MGCLPPSVGVQKAGLLTELDIRQIRLTVFGK
jgi:hypothetical protein